VLRRFAKEVSWSWQVIGVSILWIQYMLRVLSSVRGSIVRNGGIVGSLLVIVSGGK
jgi:hypothetical protein